jgi:hypothetical protein
MIRAYRLYTGPDEDSHIELGVLEFSSMKFALDGK